MMKPGRRRGCLTRSMLTAFWRSRTQPIDGVVAAAVFNTQFSGSCSSLAASQNIRRPLLCPLPRWGSSMHTSRDMLTHRGFLDCAGSLPCDSMPADRSFGGRRWSWTLVSAALETSG
jgi:hypothetical protein